LLLLINHSVALNSWQTMELEPRQSLIETGR
jgi:hypothetical protein